MNNRKLMILPLALLGVTGVGLMGCSSAKEKAEAAYADSVRMADSIAKVQEEIEAQMGEMARQDSIEQAQRDSIAKVEMFKQKIPSFYRIFKEYDDDKNIAYLKGMGYTVSKKGKIDYDKFEGEEVTTCKYSVDADHYVTVKFVDGPEWGHTEITVVGAPDELTRMKSEATRERPRYEDDHSWMEIKGNSVKWGYGA